MATSTRIERADESRFERGAWLALAFVLVFALAVLIADWSTLRLPGDGCWIDTTSPEAPVVRACRGGWPTSLRPGDTVLRVAGHDTSIDISSFAPPPPPPGWIDSALVRMTVRRDGQMLDVIVPIHQLGLGAIVRLTADQLPGQFENIITLMVVAIVFALRPRSLAAQLLLMVGAADVVGQIGLWPNSTLAGSWAVTPALWYAGQFVVLFTGWLTLPAYLLLVLSFPRRVWPLTRWPRLAAAVIVGGGIVASLACLALGKFVIFLGGLGLYATLVLGGFVAITAHTILRVRDPLVRAQTAWLGLGFTAQGLQVMIWLAGLFYPPLLDWLRNHAVFDRLTTGVLSLILPLCLGIAITRYRLFDIDIIIRRTLIYSTLTLILGLVYAGCIVVSRTLIAPYLGGTDAAIVASTLAIAALFTPLRRRIQDLIDKRFYRRKYDAAKVLAAFGATARDETDLERLTAELLHVVDETVQPEFVGLWLRAPEQDR